MSSSSSYSLGNMSHQPSPARGGNISSVFGAVVQPMFGCFSKCFGSGRSRNEPAYDALDEEEEEAPAEAAPVESAAERRACS